jgi:hypothetical protein
MNPRIKQLAEQAGFYFDEYNEPTNRKADLFAKLIIKECIGVVENLSPGYKDYRDQIEDAFRRDCVEEIKHKFGVKE